MPKHSPQNPSPNQKIVRTSAVFTDIQKLGIVFDSARNLFDVTHILFAYPID